MRHTWDACAATCESGGWQGHSRAQCRPRLTDCQPLLVAPGLGARFHGLAPKRREPQNRPKGTTMNFNDRLADLRKKRGLSQEQLGYELGVSRQTVSKWELGQSYPDFQRLVLLSDYYEMSLDELVRGVDVGDVRALNESEKQISSIYSDVERGKETALRAWRAFLVVGSVVLALFALVVAYGVLSGGLFVR